MGERKRRVHARALAGFPLLCIICLTLFGCQSVSRAPGGDSADTQAEQPPAQPAQTEGDDVADGEDETLQQPGEPEQEKGDDEPAQQDDVADDPEEEAAVAGDLNGDGIIDGRDFEIFKDAFDTREGMDAFNPDLDFDGDGEVNFVDRQIWYDMIHGT